MESWNFTQAFFKIISYRQCEFLTATDNDQWTIGQAYANFLGSFEKDAVIEITLLTERLTLNSLKEMSYWKCKMMT